MPDRPLINRLITTFVLLLTLAGIGLIILQMDQLILAIQQADWKAVPSALLFTFISYGFMSLSFALVSRMFSVPMKLFDLGIIGFITNSINHVVTASGVAGYSLRTIMMGRHGVPFGDVMAVSLLHFYLTSLDMLIMLPVGLVYLQKNAQVLPGVAVVLAIATGLLAVLALIATLIIFLSKFRRKALDAMGKAAYFIVRRDLWSSLDHFDMTMNRGVGVMKRDPRKLILVMFMTAADWVASVIVLTFCLDAFGPRPDFAVAMTGFVIGIMAGVISLVPGGLGVQEATMTGVLVLLGVPFGQAVLGTVLFRAIFFFLPYLLSLGFYRRLLRPDPASLDLPPREV